MRTSPAYIIKIYLEKYILINRLKTKQQRYLDQGLARQTLDIAYDIVHEMENLIRTNNADDFRAIKQCVREQLVRLRRELKNRQTLFELLFCETKLPNDFDRCLRSAWLQLQAYEQQHGKNFQTIKSNFTRIDRSAA